MKKLLMLIIVVSHSLLYSQKFIPIDTIEYKIKYLLVYQPDSTNVESVKAENMLLLIGEKKSLFLSEGAFLRDSIIRNMPQSQVMLLMGQLNNIPKTKFNYRIVKNKKENKITYYEKLFNVNVMYEESANQFNWKITQEQKTIGKYNCQKAIVKYGGREYEAWFSIDFPIKEGPYKFNGLPGLILELYDQKKHYHFSIESIKKVKQMQLMYLELEDYMPITKQKLYLTKKKNKENLFKMIEQRGIRLDLDAASKRRLKERLLKNNNPIELIELR